MYSIFAFIAKIEDNITTWLLLLSVQLEPWELPGAGGLDAVVIEGLPVVHSEFGDDVVVVGWAVVEDWAVVVLIDSVDVGGKVDCGVVAVPG